MRNRKTPVAIEGLPFILTAFFAALVFAAFSMMLPALLMLLVMAYIIYFFRNPQREIPEEQDALVAPADGVVIYTGNSYENHLNSEMLKISIFMSVFNVHVNRVPFSGKVVDIFYKRGKFLDARSESATSENEQSCIVLESDKGQKLAFVQVAGLIARRIVSYPGKGDYLVRGERYGLIRFGSRVDLYLPKEFNLHTKVGDKTTAGETILGHMP